MWPKEEEVEGVVEGEAEADPGVAAVVVEAPLEAEVVVVEVVGGEDIRGVEVGAGEAGEVEEEGACNSNFLAPIIPVRSCLETLWW